MAHVLSAKGEQYILQTAFSEETTVPVQFYICVHNNTLTRESVMTDITTEPVGNGYARQPVSSNNTDIVITLSSGDYLASLKSVTFAATGSWSIVSKASLVTTISGTSGIVIATWDLAAPRTLTNGDSIVVSLQLLLINQ